MKRLHSIVALCMCVWLLACAGVLPVLEALEHEHHQEHAAMGSVSHDPADHRHADADVELFSDLFGKAGFAAFGAAWIDAAHATLPAPTTATGAALIRLYPLSILPAPPPGPPPRTAAFHRGGGIPA